VSKWRIPALVLLALIALPVVAIGPEYWSPRSASQQPPPGGSRRSEQEIVASSERNPQDSNGTDTSPAKVSAPAESPSAPSGRAGGSEESVPASHEPKNNSSYAKDNLDAQQRMALAADRIVLLTVLQTIIGLLGTAAVIGALIWTIRGTKSAIAQAKAAVDSNELLRATHIAEIRPWLTLEVKPSKLYYNVNGLNLTVICRVRNIGHSPAKNVWIDTRLHAPAIGIEFSFNPLVIQTSAVAAVKARPDAPFGSLLFPDQTLRLQISMSIGRGEIERLTKEVQFLSLHMMAVVDYGFVVDASRHQTACLYDIQRTDRPRPESAEKNRAPNAVFIDEGDIAAEDLVIRPSIIAPAYAD
jgi:hypothetical protein